MLDNESQILRDILLNEGGYAPELIQEAVDEHDRTGKPFDEVVVNYGVVTKSKLLQLIAANLGTEVVRLRDREDIALDIIKKVSPETAHGYGVIPVSEEDGILSVALRNPLNYQVADDLRFMLGCDVRPLVIDDEELDVELEKYYPNVEEDIHDVIEEMRRQEKQLTLSMGDNAEDAANEAPIVKYVEVIITQAVKDKASDIHFEPFERGYRIRYRVDGALYEMPAPPKSLSLPITSRIKIMSGLNISERRVPQDGRIQLKVSGRPVDLRVSCLPTTYGESVVLRVLDRSVVNLELEALGLGQDLIDKLREMIHLPNGILLVTGPTGSGKTTTLYSCLREINTIEDKLLTAEDPVEYEIEGIIQVPVNNAVNMTFHRALRAFLRQDPDRIMVGEIRDFETAQIAIEASLTGHFVFSTLHTNDAASTITRLVDMGIEPFLICSSLVGVLGQRLIRRVCWNCKTAYIPNEEELYRLGIERADIGDVKFFYGKGCSVCSGTGYRGRKAITELLTITPPIIDMIYDNAPTVALREKARELGMRTIREDGLMAILNGETTVDEVLRYTR